MHSGLVQHTTGTLSINLFHYAILSVELRELEAKLKEAYMNKERQAQLAEKKAMEYDAEVPSVISIFSSACIKYFLESYTHTFIQRIMAGVLFD